MADPLSALRFGFEVCRVAVQDHPSLLWGSFLTGLVGSMTHCVGMCGPFVLSQTAARLEKIPAHAMSEGRRAMSSLLLPYHLGRATTYAGLGLLAGWVGQGLGLGGGLRWVAAGFLMLAALFLLLMAVPGLKNLLNGVSGGSWWGQSLGRLAQPLFTRNSWWSGWLLGVLLGFIPCGLLYAALAAAASGGQPVVGGLAMLAFTLGTVPMLVAVAVVGHFALHRWRAGLLRWAPLLLLANAGILGVMAVSLAASS